MVFEHYLFGMPVTYFPSKTKYIVFYRTILHPCTILYEKLLFISYKQFL